MIPFFRKSRKKMAGNNKTMKYLGYAIGEIMLVVIGILIALSINNWNETRKQKETTNSIYGLVKEDLINDISVIDSFLKEYDEVRKPSFESVLKTKLTKDDWVKNPDFKTVILGYKDLSINQRGSDLLKNQINLTVNIEQNLASEITLFYNQHLVEIDIAIGDIGGVFTDNTKNLNNYDWFSAFLLHNEMEGVIDYISNDPNAKNRITLYYIVFEIYANELRNFRENAKEMIIKIDKQVKANL